MERLTWLTEYIEHEIFYLFNSQKSMVNSYQYCSDKQGRHGRLALRGRQNSTPTSISPPAQEQLASTKKFLNRAVLQQLLPMTNDQ
jgi:hypothetical protein